jgi:hypothetical protein
LFFCFISQSSFILCIQTENQRKRLQEMGNLKVICVDASHNIGPKMKRATLMTVNDYLEGESLAFRICESENTETMIEFFSAVKNQIGKSINCRFFVSDDANAFFNAWVEVMYKDNNLPQKRLCTWHVNQKWTAKLNSIPNTQLNDNSPQTHRKQIKEKLFDLRSELSKTLFSEKLKKFLDCLKSNPIYEQFDEYFRRHYLERYVLWAQAYLPDDGGCNTKMHLEVWHKRLKYCYLRGNFKTRLDFFCDRLLLSDRDSQKTRQRYSELGHRNKTTDKVSITHKEAKQIWDDGKLKFERDNLQEYVVQFIVQDESCFYVVTEMAKDSSHTCSFQCKSCRTCLHLFACTCRTYRVKMNPCVHFHAISFAKKSTIWL